MKVDALFLGLLLTIGGGFSLKHWFYLRKNERVEGRDPGSEGGMMGIAMGGVLSTFFGIVLIVYAFLGE